MCCFLWPKLKRTTEIVCQRQAKKVVHTCLVAFMRDLLLYIYLPMHVLIYSECEICLSCDFRAIVVIYCVVHTHTIHSIMIFDPRERMPSAWVARRVEIKKGRAVKVDPKKRWSNCCCCGRCVPSVAHVTRNQSSAIILGNTPISRDVVIIAQSTPRCLPKFHVLLRLSDFCYE